MRRITRRVTFALLVAIVLLLALGALPGYLKSGDPYYLTATATDDRAAVPADALAPNRYPYTTAALANATENGTDDATGRSGPYWRGPIGFKEAFDHSPFDEIDAIARRNRSAATDAAVFVRANGTVYRLEVTRDP
ncbi:MAG: hypothetical protein ABEJ94_09110 [Halorientalis sp.]